MKLGCSHPIGPLALADMIGLDTMLSVMSGQAHHQTDAQISIRSYLTDASDVL